MIFIAFAPSSPLFTHSVIGFEDTSSGSHKYRVHRTSFPLDSPLFAELLNSLLTIARLLSMLRWVFLYLFSLDWLMGKSIGATYLDSSRRRRFGRRLRPSYYVILWYASNIHRTCHHHQGHTSASNCHFKWSQYVRVSCGRMYMMLIVIPNANTDNSTGIREQSYQYWPSMLIFFSFMRQPC